ncbi:Protein CLP1 like protein [Trachymyrmex septentrionalis]|uniref:Protein CLP1 like protein n=1 Tax=Trachymyrmex septentrionalis TaxID=34720 RepID=A0A195FUN9_9HYME|nr:Protein CLP1 like protein [Trachymyrmex septentrionalis]
MALPSAVFKHKGEIGNLLIEGCIIVAKPSVRYIEKKTPISLYLNCCAMLEQMRETAEKDDTRGPITMIMESRNVGKSILCGTLLNYAIRTDRRPIFVYSDTFQNNKKVKASGVIINIRLGMYHWNEEDYKLLMYAAHVFEVDVILVMDQVSFIDSIKDDVVLTNVAGFVCVTNVDVVRKTFTVLSPQPGLLPNTVLLLDI